MGSEVEVQSKAQYGNEADSVKTQVWSGLIKNYWDLSGRYAKLLPDSNKSASILYADQMCHVDLQPLRGRFLSNANSGSENVSRESNYGTQYDVGLSSYNTNLPGDFRASGKLTYYVDIANPYANKIQGALDAASASDLIRVRSGTYKENLFIAKSVGIVGSGPEGVIIDGQRLGNVARVELGTEVWLMGLMFENGYAKYGGGILNNGSLIMDNCEIQDNRAVEGGGIYNYGTINMNGGAISNSSADYGDGVYSEGTFNMNGGDISQNSAVCDGGGVYNSFTFNMNGGDISHNSAGMGGGVCNWGTFKGKGGPSLKILHYFTPRFLTLSLSQNLP